VRWCTCAAGSSLIPCDARSEGLAADAAMCLLCAATVDGPLERLLQGDRTMMTIVVVCKKGPASWPDVCAWGTPWAKSLVTVTPVGTAFHIGGILFLPFSIVFQGQPAPFLGQAMAAPSTFCPS
jgi:hypothetical protein